MQQRFGRSISDKGVHVLDPFTGTGTFIVRLLRSGIIKPEDLLYKYTSEIRNIPIKAYDYIVNGKSAIEWIVEQYAVTTDKASGIVNDPNTYAGGKYIFDLLLSIISVSLKTQALIAQLPEYKEI